jgi:hypothetical protein
MVFLAGVAAKILEWLLMMGGTYLYETTVKFIEKKKQDKIDEKNLADYKEAVKQKDLLRQAEAIRKIANGEK